MVNKPKPRLVCYLCGDKYTPTQVKRYCDVIEVYHDETDTTRGPRWPGGNMSLHRERGAGMVTVRIRCKPVEGMYCDGRPVETPTPTE